ncbi:MAG: carboxypeptidase regulatory-like domain-containing protein [Acidobacteriia bacterium]|nr:carboxypeptidase regulatory-like domain-containing protein [Terriglobia bacterium]
MRVRMILAFVILAASSLLAQTFRGTILGTVTDASGAVISGAKVTVRNVATGLERTTQTSADGSYSVPELPLGTYTVTISQSGFQTSVTTGVVVDVATERRVDAALKTGQVEQRVEVSGEELPQVETTSAELGGTLTTEAIANIPVNGRDYTKLIYLNPGVSGSPDQISDSPGSFGTFSMNGSRGRANNFLLDGTDMNDGFRNDPAINEAGVFGDPATILPIDAVAELRVLSNYEAEYGRNSGAVVNIVTKSGTNQLHGSLLEYNRTSSIGGARNFFNTAGSQDPFHNNQFGGSLGGPIIKDKTFFYVDYEGQRESGAQSGTSCVPDPRQIAADQLAIGTTNQVTAAILARNPWPTPNIPVVYDPATIPGYDTGCPTGQNLAISTRFKNRVDSLIAKIDHNFNTNNLLTGRYYFGDSDQSFPFAQLAGGLLPGFNTVTPTRVQLVSLSYVKVVNANQVNEARLGWNRFVEGFFPEDSSFNPTTIGLQTGVTSPFDFGLPKISLANFSVIGATNSIPRSRVDSNWHFIDNYSWKWGRNDIKFGYEFRRTTIQLIQDNTFRGKLSFPDLTSFLQGLPDDGKQVQGNTLRHSHENNHGFYIQDSFRMNSRLTFNFGVRWDYFGVVGEKNNLFYRLDPAAAFNVSPTNQLYDKDYNNFAPRLAFAYDVTGKGRTVVRGGWGLFYDAFAQDIFLGHVPYNCAFCPGPAYIGVGPAAIGAAGLFGGALDPNTPVFSGFSPLSDFFAADPHIRTPYTQNFNLNFQQQVGKAVFQIGYVGARGTKLFRFRDINQPSQAQITASDLADGVTSYGVPRTVYPALFYVNQAESTASSTYHSLQTSFRMNGWHGLTSAVNFVWSHSIDNASDSEDFIPNAAQPNNSLLPALERGNSNFDIRRRFTWNFGYQLPKMGGDWSKLKNGWGFDGVLNLQDGQPFQLNYNFEGDYSGASEGFDRPDVVGPIRYGSGANSVDLSAFQTPCTFGAIFPFDPNTIDESNCLAGTRHFGNLGRNSLKGPTFKELNFSVFKDTALTERLNMQIRAEFFNLFNHPNFANPNLPNFITDPATNGLDSQGRGALVLGTGHSYLPLAATGDVGIGNPFLGGGGPRGVQFAVKFTF